MTHGVRETACVGGRGEEISRKRGNKRLGNQKGRAQGERKQKRKRSEVNEALGIVPQAGGWEGMDACPGLPTKLALPGTVVPLKLLCTCAGY